MASDRHFPAEYFQKQDRSDDSLFYEAPRKVVHIDDHAIATLRDQLALLLPKHGVLLDLMSSWRSHLPESIMPQRVVGLGMNSDEMRDNPQLDEHVVHNLNRNPTLPFDDNTFDAAICTVSVQYLTNPVAIFSEVRRVIRPGGRFIVSFSNRCFPTKAVAIWTQTNDRQHLALVTRYFELAQGWESISGWQKEGSRSWFQAGDPLYIVWAEKAASGG